MNSAKDANKNGTRRRCTVASSELPNNRVPYKETIRLLNKQLNKGKKK